MFLKGPSYFPWKFINIINMSFIPVVTILEYNNLLLKSLNYFPNNEHLIKLTNHFACHNRPVTHFEQKIKFEV